jgi:hypothetical protein
MAGDGKAPTIVVEDPRLPEDSLHGSVVGGLMAAVVLPALQMT